MCPLTHSGERNECLREIKPERRRRKTDHRKKKALRRKSDKRERGRGFSLTESAQRGIDTVVGSEVSQKESKQQSKTAFSFSAINVSDDQSISITDILN